MTLIEVRRTTKSNATCQTKTCGWWKGGTGAPEAGRAHAEKMGHTVEYTIIRTNIVRGADLRAFGMRAR